jgi:hypothetical protein
VDPPFRYQPFQHLDAGLGERVARRNAIFAGLVHKALGEKQNLLLAFEDFEHEIRDVVKLQSSAELGAGNPSEPLRDKSVERQQIDVGSDESCQ